MALYLGSNKVSIHGGTFNADGTSINNQNKIVTPTTSQQTITADSGYTGLGTVTVNRIPTNYIIPSGTLSITSNGTKDVTSYASINVNVPTGSTINNQDKTVTPTTSQQSVSADSGYTGLGTVTVNAIPSSYIIPSGNKEITANGTNIDVKSYATVSVAVPTSGGDTPAAMNLPTSTSSSATSGYTSKATISRSTSTQYLNIPPGYLSSGAYYTISATPNGTVTAPSSISGTSAIISTGTNTLTLTKTISVTPSVSTAGYISAGTAGNSSVSLTASVTTKAAATYTPTTSNQTIASGTYLTGTQTISGDSNLVASNIKKGISIFGITGTYEGSGGSSKNIQYYRGGARVAATSYTATAVKLTVAVTGTYTITWSGFRSSTSGTNGSQIYKNGSALGSAQTTFTDSYWQTPQLTGQSLAAGDEIVVRARSRSTSYYMCVANLIIEQTA